jgi:hypothetical protein
VCVCVCVCVCVSARARARTHARACVCSRRVVCWALTCTKKLQPAVGMPKEKDLDTPLLSTTKRALCLLSVLSTSARVVPAAEPQSALSTSAWQNYNMLPVKRDSCFCLRSVRFKTCASLATREVSLALSAAFLDVYQSYINQRPHSKLLVRLESLFHSYRPRTSIPGGLIYYIWTHQTKFLGSL